MVAAKYVADVLFSIVGAIEPVVVNCADAIADEHGWHYGRSKALAFKEGLFRGWLAPHRGFRIYGWYRQLWAV